MEYLGIIDSRILIVDERKNTEKIRMQQLVDSNKELRDILDIEIKNMRMLMVKMYQKIHEEKMNIFISRARKQNTIRRYMTKEDCRSKASGASQ